MRKFNLSLDDMSPHPRAGLNFESIEWCEELIQDYPGLRINLFVPGAYCRLGEEKPCRLSDHPDWVEKLRSLSADNYRINMHGLYHRRTSKKYPHSNNDEWQYLDKGAADILTKGMMQEFNKVGLRDDNHNRNRVGDPKFHNTFRPPGWKISKGAMYSLQNYGVNCFAGSQEYFDKVKNAVRPETKWVSYNWDLTGPCPKIKDTWVIAYGHTSDWTNNYMNEERYKLIKDFLDQEKVEFRWIEEW